jgi:hypothetical protein
MASDLVEYMYQKGFYNFASFRTCILLLLVLNAISIILLELMLMEASPKYLKSDVVSKHILSFISFIVPTSLSRVSLTSTILSIKMQSVNNWEIIVGVDVDKINHSVASLNSEPVFNHSRIRVVHVDSASSDRGACGNGAGEIRNILIRNYSDSKWVGFVDDDDVVESSYVKFLQDALDFDKDADFVIFQMMLPSGYLVPTRRHFNKRYVLKNYVGISYAVRRALFTSKNKSIEFKASCTEDYDLIKNALEFGYSIIMSDCIAYHVRPLLTFDQDFTRHRHCTFRKLKQAYDAPPGKARSVKGIKT